MKSTGIIRQLDTAGRIVIPNEIRKQLDMVDGVDKFEIYMQDRLVILKKYEPSCALCGKLGPSVLFNETTICHECIDKLYAMKPE